MAQGVSRQPLTAEARARSQAVSCQIRGGQSGTVTCSFTSNSGLPRQYHSTFAPHSFIQSLTLCR